MKTTTRTDHAMSPQIAAMSPTITPIDISAADPAAAAREEKRIKSQVSQKVPAFSGDRETVGER
jgi:hypothetical protein